MASERVERKLAAIVAADVAGYSRLMAADEEGTLARLKGHRKSLIDPKIAEHGGRIIKTTGDGMLLEFASVVDAVRCLVEIQRGMLERNADIPPEKRIDFRVGINVGDVIVDGDDIYGDGVNVAARLEGLAEPGGILVAGVVRDQVRDKLSFSFDDLGDRNVKNIPRPVRAYRVKLNDEGPSSAKPTAGVGLRGWRIAGIAAALLLIVVGVAAWYFESGSNSEATLGKQSAALPPLADPAKPLPHLSIVVLPFANLSGDPAQDYFADGVTDNLTTELSRIRHSFVIARNTAFSYKGKVTDAKEIGKALGVRYLLEGSVQRDQSRVRVNAQLIDAESGAHLWADRFEEDVADLFKLQDQVVARLANALGFELTKAEAARDAGLKHPDATDFAMRGKVLMAHAVKNTSRENYDAAIAMFEKALAIDSDEPDALAGEAETYIVEMFTAARPIDQSLAAKALGEADKATGLAPNSPGAYSAKALCLVFLSRYREAIRVADEGLAINPNYVALYVQRSEAQLSTSIGQYERAKSDIQQAMRLSPLDPQAGIFHDQLGFAEFALGHYDASANEFGRALDAGFRPLTTYAGLAAAYAAEDKTLEAKAALEQARQVNPNVTIKYLTAHIYSFPGFFEALKKVGVPYE